MNRPPFPAVLDSTIVSAFRACPRKAFLEYVNHWKSKTPSVHLHAGAAFAHGLEVARRAFYSQGVSPDVALDEGIRALLSFYGDFECPDDSAKSAARMAGALEFYFERYPLASDPVRPTTMPGGSLGVEFSFAEPIDIPHPETGDPIIYCGRMDMVAEFAGGLYVFDDKTTSSLGASWSRQWDLRSQFSGYAWGCQQVGLRTDGVLVRGISILKTKYDTEQAISYRPQWQIDRWYEQLLRDVTRMKECWENGIWDYDLSESCNAYGGCAFRSGCLMMDPSAWLETYFERRVWNPITRQEEKPE